MLRVMLAEDNDLIRQMMADCLGRKPGIQIVCAARDGSEAEQMLMEHRPDILLLDLVMPKIDGLELMRKIVKSCSFEDLRIIVMTSLISDQIIRQAMQLGAAYYMVKPFDPDVLYNRLLEIGEDKERQHAMPTLMVNNRPGDLLKMHGIGCSLKGYGYLLAVLEEARMLREDERKVTKALYPAVGRRYNVNPANVERAIRSAIDTAWRRGNLQRGGLFGANERPSNGEFIGRLLNELEHGQM